MVANAGARATPPGPRTTVASLLSHRPAAARVFLEHGMACVGCSLAAFDTLADAAREYDLPLAGFLNELALAAKAPGSSPPTDRRDR